MLLKEGESWTGLLIENGCGYIDPTDERNLSYITELNKISTSKSTIGMMEPLVLFVILQKYDILNKNGRIYPKSVLMREAKRYQTLIDQRLAIGEAEHPESTIINSDRVSHEIRKIWFEGQTMVGEMEIIMSPGYVNQGIISCVGDNIANLLRKGIRIGVSSRGVGSVTERKGSLIVQEDFELICWDIVTNPSTPGSYMFDNKSLATPFMESVSPNTLLDEKLKKFLLN